MIRDMIIRLLPAGKARLQDVISLSKLASQTFCMETYFLVSLAWLTTNSVFFFSGLSVA